MEIKKRVVILKSDDWGGIYVDAKLVSEGHSFNNGDNLLLLKLSEQFNFTSNDVISEYMNLEDIETTEANGSFPQNLYDLKGNYDEKNV